MNRRVLRDIGLEIWLPILLVVIWWFASASSTSFYFPPLSKILETFADDWLNPANSGENLVPSLSILGAAYGLALVTGVVLGTLFGLVTPLERAARPLLETLRAIPGVIETGLFVGRADVVLVGHDDRVDRLTRP